MTKKVNSKKNSISKKQLELFEKEDLKKINNPFGLVFKEKLSKQIVIGAIFVILIVFIILNLNHIGAFIKKIIVILMPIIVGWVLTYLISPLYNLLIDLFTKNKHTKGIDSIISKFAKPIATVLCTLVVLLTGVGLLYLFIPQLYISLSKFLQKVPAYYENIIKSIENYENSSQDQFTKKIFTDIGNAIEDLISNSSNFEHINFTRVFSNVYNGFYFSFKMILNIFVGIIVMMYTLNLKTEMLNGLKRIMFALLRKDIAQKLLVEIRYANKVFSGFIVGKLLDSLIIGILCYICCRIMNMPYTPLISVIVGITNIIPFFGPFIGAIPSFLIIILEEPFTWRPWGFLIFIFALQQLDGNVIGPKILGDKTGVGSFWVLFSIILFGGLFGPVGMIIAVPLWAIITKLFEEFVVLRLKERNYPLTTEDYKKLKEYNESLKKTNGQS